MAEQTPNHEINTMVPGEDTQSIEPGTQASIGERLKASVWRLLHLRARQDQDGTTLQESNGLPKPTLSDLLKITPERLPTGYEKHAPDFREVVQDTSRTEPITIITGKDQYFETSTGVADSTQNDKVEVREVKEHDVLSDIERFLTEAINKSTQSSDPQIAQSMLENLAWIGYPELAEASRAIADKWKEWLIAHPEGQLCVITQGSGNRFASIVKSGDWILDHILGNMSVDDREKMKGRLVFDPNEIRADPQNVNVVVLDDASLSGAQMKNACKGFLAQYPQYAACLSVQLVIATEERLKNGVLLERANLELARKLLQKRGVNVSHVVFDTYLRIPVSAYYLGKSTEYVPTTWGGAFMTNFYSSADFSFGYHIQQLAKDLRINMPLGLNIVRPYRMPTYIAVNLARWLGMSADELALATDQSNQARITNHKDAPRPSH